MSFSTKNTIDWNGAEAMKGFDLAVQQALTESAILVEGKAVSKAPVDTSRLKQSITRIVDKTSAYVGTNVEYAPYVEFGTRRQKAQPYLRLALSSSISAIKGFFAKRIKGVKFVD